MLEKNIVLPINEIQALCRRYPIHKLSLFGSVLRDDFTPDSDIDMLVEFEPGARISYFDLASLQLDLRAMLGRDVDIGTPAMLSQHIRSQVLKDAQVIYERG